MATNGSGPKARRRRTRRNGRQRGGMPRLLRILGVLAVIGFVGLVVLVVAAVIMYRSYADELVAPDELAINEPSFGAKILDRNGNLLYEYVDDRSGLRRPIKLENVSDAFLAATISTEDDSFYTNSGVNVKGILRAAWENVTDRLGTSSSVFEGSGGSSITQQLVKNVYIPEKERQQRSISRKVKETIYAIELTRRYDKDKILEWYVNQISYGGVYNGIEAASLGYFGKPAKDLTLGEAALLAGIPQSPAAYDPVNHPDAAEARRNEVLDLMERQGRIQIGKNKYFEATKEEVAAARDEPINITVKRFPIQAPHFVLEYVEPQLEQMLGHEALLRDGLVVTTTLDLDLENKANEILEKWISEFEKTSNSHNGAVIVIDPKTGEILAMVGSRDYFREDIQGKNNNVVALNSPGSSFKPFVYLTAFMKLGWGPGTIVLDSPVIFKQPDGTDFAPTNPGHDFHGPITIRSALGNSFNVPADKTAAAAGVENIVQLAKKMGFTTLTGSYGPAIATGGVDISAIDLAYGYTVFANGGVMRGQAAIVNHRPGERKIDPISILKVTDAQGRVRFDVNQRRAEEKIVPEEYAYLVTSVLADPQSTCITFGCGGISVPGRVVAVKTGTSEPFDPKGPNAGKIGDTWAFGYTPDIVVGIWAGNSDNAPVVNIFSTSISFRAMRDTLLAAYGDKKTTPFARPEKVVQAAVCVPSGKKPTPLCGKTTQDIFAKDQVPTQDDDWWQRVRIDGRNGLRAGPGTPSQFVQEQVMLVVPGDQLKTEDDKKHWQEWADTLGIPLAPTETSSAGGTASDITAIILSPAAGANLSGPVQVIGRAASAGFQSYRLEFGSGASPPAWTAIGQGNSPVESGVLGTWNVTGLPPGPYTLRLVVQDRQRGTLIATVPVNVGTPATAIPGLTATPPARP